MVLLTCRDRMLEITHVQLGMESADKAMLLLQYRYSVSLIIRSYLSQFSFVFCSMSHSKAPNRVL